jgi:hypothetical protein
MGAGTVSLDVVRPAPPIENLLNNWEGGKGAEGGGRQADSQGSAHRSCRSARGLGRPRDGRAACLGAGIGYEPKAKVSTTKIHCMTVCGTMVAPMRTSDFSRSENFRNVGWRADSPSW